MLFVANDDVIEAFVAGWIRRPPSNVPFLKVKLWKGTDPLDALASLCVVTGQRCNPNTSFDGDSA